jgi:hypothetical protein
MNTILLNNIGLNSNLNKSLVKQILIKNPYSITDNKFDAKQYISPNDYASNATYYWPDETKSDGLPYIEKLEPNPDKYTTSDRKYIDILINDLLLLTAFYLNKNKNKYARKAIELLRVFFIDSATRMNPNLDYSGYIKYTDSNTIHKNIKLRGNIIDTNSFCILPDMMIILNDYLSETNNFLDKKVHQQMQLWFRNMASWFMYSEYGIKHSKKENNILSSYYLQLASYIYGSGEIDLAKKILQDNVHRVLSAQIDEDGNQVHEIKRLHPIHYCNFNLDMLSKLLIISKNLDIDIYNYQDNQGRGNVLKAMIKAADNIKKKGILSELNQNEYAISWISIATKIYNNNIFLELGDMYKSKNFYYFNYKI